MTDDERSPDERADDFIDLLRLVVERVTTLSVQVETLRGLLAAHGAIEAAEFDQQAGALRARWDLPSHPLPADEAVARLRRFVTPQATDGASS